MSGAGRLPEAARTPGVVYGLALLASGWILGPLRVLLVAPLVGSFAAVFFEAPLMIAVMVLTVRWLARHHWIGSRRNDRVTVGLVGAGIVLLGEGAGGRLMTGGWGSLNTFTTPEGLIGLLLVSAAALTPVSLLSWPRSRPRLR
ncbi:hypothetical protein BH11PSE1_BH11PSE1_25940 [soil metagenome]